VKKKSDASRSYRKPSRAQRQGKEEREPTEKPTTTTARRPLGMQALLDPSEFSKMDAKDMHVDLMMGDAILVK